MFSAFQLIDWPEGGYLKTDSPMPLGEIVIGGPNVKVWYFKNEAKTEEVYKVEFKIFVTLFCLCIYKRKSCVASDTELCQFFVAKGWWERNEVVLHGWHRTVSFWWLPWDNRS